MINKLIKSHKGFSLIEVVVAMLIFTIVTSGFAFIFSSSVRQNQVMGEEANAIREAVSNIDRALAGEESEAVTIYPGATMEITINGRPKISVDGYIVEGSEDANSRAFFPNR